MFHVSKFYFVIGGILVLIVGIMFYILFRQSSIPAAPIPTPTPMVINNSMEIPTSSLIQLASPPQTGLQKITVGTPIIVQLAGQKTPTQITYSLFPERETEYYIQDNAQIRIVPKTFWLPNILYKLTITSVTYDDGTVQPLNTIIEFQAKNTDDETESPAEVDNNP